jgi:hypothetical protein
MVLETEHQGGKLCSREIAMLSMEKAEGRARFSACCEFIRVPGNGATLPPLPCYPGALRNCPAVAGLADIKGRPILASVRDVTERAKLSPE